MRSRYVLLGLLGLVATWAIATSTSSLKPSGPERPAPDIAIAAANDHNRVVRLSDLKGKVVLLDFWATWCGPCRMSIPGIQKLYDKHHGRGFEVMGVALERDNGEGIAPFTRDMKMTYPAGSPTERSGPVAYVSGGIPQMVLVDRKGTVRWLPESGYSTQMEAELGEKVESLLSE
jgi:thiol-disulfide isomerase/thioredoxin